MPQIPDFIWQAMKPLNNTIARRYSPNFRGGNLIMLLTTTGRVSGQPRITPLQFEEWDGTYYVASARGVEADWFKNILKDPCVEVQIKDRSYKAEAEAITDPIRIADFLELRLERRPKMIGRLMRVEGLPRNHTRADLEAFASDKALVALHLN